MKHQIEAKKELLKELIKSMQAKMLEDQEPEAEAAPECCEREECDCAEEVSPEEVEAPEGDDIDVMQILQGKRPVKPKVKVTIAALGTKLSQMQALPPKKKYQER